MQINVPKRPRPYNINIQEGHKASRFVVNLNRPPEAEVAKDATAGEKIKDYLSDFLHQGATAPKAEPMADRFVIALRRLLNQLGSILRNLFLRIKSTAALPQRIFYRFFIKPATAARDRSAADQETYVVQPLFSEVASDTPSNFRRFLSFFIFPLILAVLVLPIKAYTYFWTLDEIKGRVTEDSKNAIEQLFSAGKSAEALDFQRASRNFSAASQTFADARQKLDSINDLLLKLAALAPDKQARLAASAKAILLSGDAASRLGKDLSLAVDNLNEREGKDLIEVLADFLKYAQRAVGAANDLDAAMKEIEAAAIPAEYQERFKLMKDNSAGLAGSLADLVDLVEKLNLALGSQEMKRYLVVFQNNTEARATGGFLGSYALVDFYRGKVKNLEVPGGGTYDTEAGLRERVVAPQPLWLVNPLWHLWDSNWWPDWPTSARKIAWFFEKSNGPTVDGVISLTPNVLSELLKITGPVDLSEDYGVTIDADNFFEILQAQSEQKPDVTRQPKRIIGDLLGKIMADLPASLDQGKLMALMQAVEASLNEKHILIYFKANDLESAISRYGWDGSVRAASRDYLMVVNTNIGGAKSDRRVNEGIEHRAEIAADGSIVDTVTITRTHAGGKGENWSGVRNVNWLRIYVPSGSELLAAEGFTPPDASYFSQPADGWTTDPDLMTENAAIVDQRTGTHIYDEAGKTVFANWSMIDPGGTAVLKLKYRLPFKLAEPTKDSFTDKLLALISDQTKDYGRYSLLVQKQAGSSGARFNSVVTLAPGSNFDPRPAWRYPIQSTTKNPGELWRLETVLNADKHWAVLLENK